LYLGCRWGRLWGSVMRCTVGCRGCSWQSMTLGAAAVKSIEGIYAPTPTLDDAGGRRVRLKFSTVSIPLKSLSSFYTGPCDSVTASNLRSDDDPPRPDQPACWLVPAALATGHHVSPCGDCRLCLTNTDRCGLRCWPPPTRPPMPPRGGNLRDTRNPPAMAQATDRAEV